jgi:uncharacterized membrane protein
MIRFVKNALFAVKDLVATNKQVVSVFLIENQNSAPTKVLINRELVAALLNNILQLALSTSKKKSTSIYISWTPINQKAS